MGTGYSQQQFRAMSEPSFRDASESVLNTIMRARERMIAFDAVGVTHEQHEALGWATEMYGKLIVSDPIDPDEYE